MEEFELIAKTFQGLEGVLAEELTALGANNIEIGIRMVSFTGDKELMYKANFCLRTAIRILKPIKHFTANTADEVYEAVKAIDWEQYLDTKKTFAIDSVVYSEEFRHSKFVAYRVKDAIADYFNEKYGERPSVRLNNPDLNLNIHIAQNRCTLSLDSSGESLHRRGYRQEAVEAPLNEVLAAGMILLTGWRGECDLIDPMCGSGTIPIEAALIARNIAPGIFRKEFAFEKWPDFDQQLFDSIYNDDSQEREFTHKIYGYDNNPKANTIATHNVKAAGLSKDITLKVQAFQQFEAPTEKSIIITNPPYGERISTDDLLGLYQMIGERLKHAFTGNDAWILSYREECFEQIGLKPSEKIPLFNGALECEFRKYQIFDGKYKEFRQNSTEEFKTKREELPYKSRVNRHKDDGERSSYGDRRKPRFDKEGDGEKRTSFGERRSRFGKEGFGKDGDKERSSYGDHRKPRFDKDREDGDKRSSYGERRSSRFGKEDGDKHSSFGDRRKPRFDKEGHGEKRSSFGERRSRFDKDKEEGGKRSSFGERRGSRFGKEGDRDHKRTFSRKEGDESLPKRPINNGDDNHEVED